jgi:hypothetical protein
MDWNEVKTIEDCIECALVDTYHEDEAVAAWETCLSEVFNGLKNVQHGDEILTLKGFELDGYEMMAVISDGKNSLAVPIEDIDWPKLSKAQKLWLKAWEEWSQNQDFGSDEEDESEDE